eukprot:GHVU01083206.1.p1 GENE.GHVU01083206.1~~GHVU01083206.1.p1  ORF type:complete len:219 (+),score=14.71 GHVU01083206.1:1689-2345(+)
MRSYANVCKRISILGAAPQARVCSQPDQPKFELHLLRDQIGPENDIGGVNLKISSEVSGTVKIHDANADQLKKAAENARVYCPGYADVKFIRGPNETLDFDGTSKMQFSQVISSIPQHLFSVFKSTGRAQEFGSSASDYEAKIVLYCWPAGPSKVATNIKDYPIEAGDQVELLAVRKDGHGIYEAYGGRRVSTRPSTHTSCQSWGHRHAPPRRRRRQT